MVITFICADAESGIATCSPPVTRWANEQGAIVTGEAVDNAGNRATTSIVVNIDKVAPVMTLHAPEESDVLPPDTTEVTIKGNAVDGLSAVGLVTCNGMTATLEGQRYTCLVPASQGVNTIHLVAGDLAGNTTSRDITVRVDDPQPPTSLEITPETMTLLPGEHRQLRVNDQRGKSVTGGTLSVGNALIAQVEITDGVPFVHALAGGQTTITLTRDALTAEATVTVLPEGTTTIPDGTSLWTLKATPPPPNGTQLLMRGRIVRAVPAPAPEGLEPPALFFVEHEYGGGIPARVVATTWEGRALWRRTTSQQVTQFAADNRGGLIMVSSSYYDSGGFLHTLPTIRRLDGATGAVSWEYLGTPGQGSVRPVAIHPDGTVYTVQSDTDATYLLALEGSSGAVKARFPLGGSGRQAVNATAPVVRQDGTVAVFAHRWKDEWSYQNPQTILFEVDAATLGISESEINTDFLSTLDRSPLRNKHGRFVELLLSLVRIFPGHREDSR